MPSGSHRADSGVSLGGGRSDGAAAADAPGTGSRRGRPADEGAPPRSGRHARPEPEPTESAAGPAEPKVQCSAATVVEVTDEVPPASSRSSHRARRGPSLARALGWTLISAFVPGAGHLAAGRKRVGSALLAAFSLLVIVGALIALNTPRAQWVRIAVEPDSLERLMIVAVVGGVCWALVVLTSWLAHQPARLGTGRRVIGTAVALALSFGVATPFVVGAHAAYVQRDLITNLFTALPAANPVPVVVAAPQPARPVGFGPSRGIFVGKPRVNVLLLGGDGGFDRTGVRTDSMVVASIDTVSARTVLISVPRNLQGAQFPLDTPMAKRYPNGFDDMLNAVYQYGQDHREVMAGTPFPGGELTKATVSWTLGLPIDYFMLINLDGFKDFVDAFGGVTMTVDRPLPIGGRHDGKGRVTMQPTGYLAPGHRKLDGYEALWYGRSRFDSSDYARMARQRCLLGAIAKQASPVKVLTNFSKLAAAAKRIILTDIPQAALPELLTLAGQAKHADLISVAFVRSAHFDPAHPDFEFMQQEVAGAISTVSAPTPAPKYEAASRDAGHNRKSVTQKAPAPAPADLNGPVDLTAVC